MNFSHCLSQLRDGHALTNDQVAWLAGYLLAPDTSDEHRAALLRALTSKGETEDEIAAFVRAFLHHAVRPKIDLAQLGKPALDVCGTGGDKLDLFNISTTCMFILAGAGAAVVKHGNRGITSQSGGADVLEALGVRIDLPPDRLGRCLEETGAAFMFAPLYHPAFKSVAPVRKQLAAEGIRTVMNLIGPLLNPVQPANQLVGVSQAALTPAYARILQKLGRSRAWAVHGTTERGEGMDELSSIGSSQIWISSPSSISREILDPTSLGLSPATTADLRGGDAPANAAILLSILSGAERGPKREIAVLNAAAGLIIVGLAPDWAAALAQADESIDSGAALQVLEKMRRFI